jgi:rubrerythrin
VKNRQNNLSLKDSKTEQNLKDAFAGESQANRRYLYFAAKAERSHANRFQKALDTLDG